MGLAKGKNGERLASQRGPFSKRNEHAVESAGELCACDQRPWVEHLLC